MRAPFGCSRQLLVCFVVLTLRIVPAYGQVVERWADPALSPPAGLELWIDASRQRAAAESHGEVISEDGHLATAYDASGRGRHLRQPRSEARPRLLRTAGVDALRFDGIDDHLTLSKLQDSIDSMTVFLVVRPFSNRGGFRAFLAASREDANDYVSGVTLDQGPTRSSRFESLNPEGSGFGGARDVMTEAFEFGTLHTLTVVASASEVLTFVDEVRLDARPRTTADLSLNRWVLGARYYDNLGPPRVRGFLSGDISEVLVFRRALDDSERRTVLAYLQKKYDAARSERVLPGEASQPLVEVEGPPVQVLVPGFRVATLPLDLPNLNNVRYRDDGRVMALAYDGSMFLLSDKDGDGLEDAASLFFEAGSFRGPIGMALTPRGYPHGQGAFVASKGKLSLVVDTDGDERADEEIVVATGWKEIPPNVDALGVAIDPEDASVYFGLGTHSYEHPYDGYDLASERGTILRVSPDLERREIFCTGIRFSVGLAFNAAGDLFCTDQEGATWLANGNPFDELLHLQRGRHYGFPPRHPRHLPGVIDEPSTFDYRPQHQSTCGLLFNEPLPGGRTFGPEQWRGDAFVCGFSRGQLYRTQLVKTEAGYIARTQLLARLRHLTADASLSPAGDLLICTHSGGPDWGTGPTGRGKLFKLIAIGEEARPMPVLAWAQSPQELRVAYDRPLSPEDVSGIAERVTVEYGRYVAPGDRFEVHRPGYEVVRRQLDAPRFRLPVDQVLLTPDRRTLLLRTRPQSWALPHAITISDKDANPSGSDGRHPTTDLALDLNGVAVTFDNRSTGSHTESGWPHLDPSVARELTRGSSEHEHLFESLASPGRLTLACQLDLVDMLRPAVQEGSRIDYRWPPETVTLELVSDRALQIVSAGSVTQRTAEGRYEVSITVTPDGESLHPLRISLETGREAPLLQVTWHTVEDSRRRPLPLHRLRVPWATVSASSGMASSEARRLPAELEGGSWARGRAVFHSRQAACSTCHARGGAGGHIGPDLAALVHRDPHSVLRDIREPSAALNPDYLSTLVELKDGRLLTGVLREQKGRLVLGDRDGKLVSLEREEIAQMSASPVSTMPEGLLDSLDDTQRRDLLNYLLTPPPRMPEYGKLSPPPPRDRDAVSPWIEASQAGTSSPAPLSLLLVTGDKDHGPGEHDYPAWQKVWAELLSAAPGVRVATAYPWPTDAQWESADVVVFFQKGAFDSARAQVVDRHLARGGGLVYLHWAIEGGDEAGAFAERIGLASDARQTRYRHGPLELDFRGSDHPIAQGFETLALHDESYWNLVGDPAGIDVIATANEEGAARPLIWTKEVGPGRVFVSILGHYSWTFDDPLVRVLLLRGIAWSGKRFLDRLAPLAFEGARIE